MRRPNEYCPPRQKREDELPSWRSCLIALVFIAVCGDFSFLFDLKPINPSPGSPAWEQCLRELTGVMREFQKAVEAGTITPDQGGEAQTRVVLLEAKLNLGRSDRTKVICEETRRIFLSKSPLPPEMSEGLRKELESNPYQRQIWANEKFHTLWTMAQNKANA